MSNLTRELRGSAVPAPLPDQAERERALDPARSVLVQAPAGSGKTDLLTRRFLRLLAEVEDPSQIVAITFTKAAAAEMRNRILEKLEEASARLFAASPDEFSMESLAARALEHSRSLGWNLLELPAQLRISTIDSFCREIALRRPLLSSLGGSLEIREPANDLYRRAARNTLLKLGDSRSSSEGLTDSIARLLDWRDNKWQELEGDLVAMLAKRDQWMQEFWLREFRHDSEENWAALRERLERPFALSVARGLDELSALLAEVQGACEEALELARFACQHPGGERYRELAEMAEVPFSPFSSKEELEGGRLAYLCLGNFLLTQQGKLRQTVNKMNGFPLDRRREKQRFDELKRALERVEGLECALQAVRDLPPATYPDEEWRIIRACFTLLRHAAAELQVVFAEVGVVDYVEIAQIAYGILKGEEQQPSDTAIAIADEIHHLLIDEFQDTSRRQHRLIGALVGAWPDFAGRSVFVVGDPMQSIYFFRDADAELFPRVRAEGLELPGDDPLKLDFARLSSNFRTRPELVDTLNETFQAIFSINDGSNVSFAAAGPARSRADESSPAFRLHLDFVPQPAHGRRSGTPLEGMEDAIERRDATRQAQVDEIVALVRGHLKRMEQARKHGKKYRVAILGRAREALAPIAAALRKASIPFRAVDLELLGERPEVVDAVALARALLNAEDRTAWLSVLRAPWCGLSLADLHLAVSADDETLRRRPVLELLRERASMLSAEGRAAVARVLQAFDEAAALRAASPGLAPGTWIEQVWLRLGGAACAGAGERANLSLLWRALDNLPEGEPDLCGPALDAALTNLRAEGDPAAESDCGVHVMTIHKSKGLEFEVVIVPELQARCGRSGRAMLSWLERGLAHRDDSGELTEFLVAPFQPKGGERGKAKAWVDAQYRARESQENRRVLYVAATRAREELHLFARPEYKMEEGEPALCGLRESLLSTAWPALEERVLALFASWKASPQPAEVLDMAAGSGDLITIRPVRPAILQRLPLEFVPPTAASLVRPRSRATGGADDLTPYRRHEGGIPSRLLGSAVHFVFDQVAQMRIHLDWDEIRAKIGELRPRMVAMTRSAGITREESERIAGEALEIAFSACEDPTGAWILSPHADAASEVGWTGMVDGSLRTVRADRVFRAGPEPISDGEDAWWIVDYKTAHVADASSRAFTELRQLFAPQLEIYARFLKKIEGPQRPIRAGLYYPRMLKFDWWEL